MLFQMNPIGYFITVSQKTKHIRVFWRCNRWRPAAKRAHAGNLETRAIIYLIYFLEIIGNKSQQFHKNESCIWAGGAFTPLCHAAESAHGERADQCRIGKRKSSHAQLYIIIFHFFRFFIISINTFSYHHTGFPSGIIR